ncbi:MAG: lytic transglycosylase domain-containing protein [Dehalococcoidia bacterium]|nr:MAG: lytic transglycosylase domain-containing protein [Dehalococcoidia bacterium]
MAAIPVVLFALDALPREGVKAAAAIIALIVVPVVVVVLVAAAWIGTALFGFGLGGDAALPPPIPPTHLAVMQEVAAESGVPWPLLAAIASVESGFGANMTTSWAGAVGYGQFMPASWAAFGQGGDPYDYRDVIPAMARYLVAAGAPADIPNAVYAYNHSWEYVALVLGRMAVYASHGPEAIPAGTAGVLP